MVSNHIQQALAQVRELQQKILEKQRFKGYSGRARAISGILALVAAVVMSSRAFPADTRAHLLGWGIVFLAGFLLNFGALIQWFLFDPHVNRNIRRLKPVMDTLPVFVVGGIFTLIFTAHGLHDYLFGTWMCLFGLANLASRHVLPPKISWVGWYYILAGSACLLFLEVPFTNPWPMGLVFFFGELAGGIILHFDGSIPVTLENLVHMIFSIKEHPNASSK